LTVTMMCAAVIFGFGEDDPGENEGMGLVELLL
jgi:hypothetical protein